VIAVFRPPNGPDCPIYTPGKTVPGAIKIASNEKVHGPLSERAGPAIDKAADNINRIPTLEYVELKDGLAKHIGRRAFAPRHISVG